MASKIESKYINNNLRPAALLGCCAHSTPADAESFARDCVSIALLVRKPSACEANETARAPMCP